MKYVLRSHLSIEECRQRLRQNIESGYWILLALPYGKVWGSVHSRSFELQYSLQGGISYDQRTTLRGKFENDQSGTTIRCRFASFSWRLSAILVATAAVITVVVGLLTGGSINEVLRLVVPVALICCALMVALWIFDKISNRMPRNTYLLDFLRRTVEAEDVSL